MIIRESYPGDLRGINGSCLSGRVKSLDNSAFANVLPSLYHADTGRARFRGAQCADTQRSGGVTLQGFQEGLLVEDKSSDRSEEIETWRSVLAGYERCVPSLFVLICAVANRTKRAPEFVGAPYPCEGALEKSKTRAPCARGGCMATPGEMGV